MTARSTASEIDARVAGLTIPKQFLQLAEQHPDATLLKSMTADGGWNTFTVSDVRSLAARVAAGLAANDVTPGERVLLMMRNRPDFHWFDLGAQFVRATPVSIYNSSSPEEIQYLAHHAEAEVAVLEDDSFLERVLKVRDELPHLQQIYVIHPPEGPLPDGVFAAADLLGHGEADLDALGDATSPDDLATLIYTSGTTGPPKGVMLSQYNIVFTVELLLECFERTHEEAQGWRVVSYLPMAHIAERATSHYGTLVFGYEVACCPDPNELMPYLKEVQPQLLFGVPRVFEKIYAGVNAALAADPEKQQQFNDGVAAAIEINRAKFDGTATQEQLDTLSFLDAVAFEAVRGLVGLDAIELAITGAAPLPAEILEWFNAIGVPLSEIYGMSESTGPMTWTPLRNKPGYVGQAIPGMEVAIAEDGEVIARGGNVFQGYLKQPEKTAETIIDGWLHSGDIGELDDEGYLKIVDRKKELIITSGGKNISPANLEAALKMIPLIGQACAIGDQRKFCSALLVLDPEAAPIWAAANGKEGMSLLELAEDPDVRAVIQAGVDEANQQFAQVEQIKKFVLLGEEWLPDSDLLTPTSKLKRRGIHARYADEIESMYA
ncbi:MAG: long-chain fatty acid--CoA ligase [Ilumatobacter sp.]|uniref:AMP-dependent synthetase/ligase n=1 Tax=Ilumatobacter sp. TaxID=1967498 RepID=UPI00261D68C6|nr:long-chain fatty acid--CoA ligase [Ilumatobacter sp.]MDJ0769808.1 long-chain fatty acid--CoA ligase [Ilumatobacter sp.]